MPRSSISVRRRSESAVALGYFGLAILEQRLQLAHVMLHGLGERREVERQEVGVGQPNDGRARHLGERAAVGDVLALRPDYKDFAYGRALAQVAGTAVIRLADADLLPFDFAALADTVQTYVGELQALLKDRQAEVTERNRLIRDGVYTETEDPRHPITPPAIEPVPPALNFAPLENAARALTQAADRYAAAARGVSASALTAAPATVRAVNARLRQSERQLTDADGLPRRPWYRHLLYAPGFYTGYDVKTMPGVREGIEQRHTRRPRRKPPAWQQRSCAKSIWSRPPPRTSSDWPRPPRAEAPERLHHGSTSRLTA